MDIIFCKLKDWKNMHLFSLKNSKISIFPPFCRFLEQITAKLFVWSSSWLYNILDLINHSDLASKNVGGKSDQGDRTQVKEKFLKKIFS